MTSNLQGENSTWLIFIPISLKGCIRRQHFADFRLFNRLSAFLSYKLRFVVQGCSNTSNHQAGISLQRAKGTSGGRISPHKEGSRSARIILKTDFSKEASTWKDLDADSSQALFQQYGKIIARAVFSAKSSKRKHMWFLVVYIIDFSALLCACRIAVVSFALFLSLQSMLNLEN